MIDRLKHDRRLHIIIGIVSVIIFGITPIIIGYTQGTSELTNDNVRRQVMTDDEHCAITIPAQWEWQPASWTAISPKGSQLGFSEIFLGRPENPEWHEVADEVLERAAARNDAQVTQTDNSIRIDYGPDGGLSFIQRYDWIVCRLTFSGQADSKSIELPVWEQIIDSLARVSPTGTPPEELPWRPKTPTPAE